MINKKIVLSLVLLSVFMITGCDNSSVSISNSYPSQETASKSKTNLSTTDVLLNFDKYKWDLSRRNLIERNGGEISDFPSAFDEPTPEDFSLWHKGLPLKEVSTDNFSVVAQNDIDSENTMVNTSTGEITYKDILSSKLDEMISEVTVNKDDKSDNFIIYNKITDNFQQATKFTIDGSENYIIIYSENAPLEYAYAITLSNAFSIIKGTEYSEDIKDGSYIITSSQLDKEEKGVGAITLPTILDTDGKEVEYDFSITKESISIKIRPTKTTTFPIVSCIDISI